MSDKTRFLLVRKVIHYTLKTTVFAEVFVSCTLATNELVDEFTSKTTSTLGFKDKMSRFI